MVKNKKEPENMTGGEFGFLCLGILLGLVLGATFLAPKNTPQTQDNQTQDWVKELRCVKSINATVYEDCERTSESQWTISYCTRKVEEVCVEKQEFWVRK